MEKTLRIVHVKKVSSTNAYLSELDDVLQWESGSMIVTDVQTSGRGQAGNVWESGKGKNLLCSVWLVPDELEAIDQFYISKAIALACKDLLDEFIEGVTLKWPNDIYCGNKKIGGILIENSIIGSRIKSSIAGVGININQQEFSNALPNPTSVRLISGTKFKPADMAKFLQSHILNWLDLLNKKAYKEIDDAYFSSLYRKKGEWKFSANNELFLGSIKDVLPSGQLILKTLAGEKAFWFKEVEFVLD